MLGSTSTGSPHTHNHRHRHRPEHPERLSFQDDLPVELEDELGVCDVSMEGISAAPTETPPPVATGLPVGPMPIDQELQGRSTNRDPKFLGALRMGVAQHQAPTSEGLAQSVVLTPLHLKPPADSAEPQPPSSAPAQGEGAGGVPCTLALLYQLGTAAQRGTAHPAALLPGVLALHPALQSPWALNVSTHPEARKAVSTAVKQAICQAQRGPGGAAGLWREAGTSALDVGSGALLGGGLLMLLQVDGCVFVAGLGEAGHVLLCQDGRPLRVEHSILANMAPARPQDVEQPSAGAPQHGNRAHMGGHLVPPEELGEWDGPVREWGGCADPDVVPIVLDPRDSFLVAASAGLLQVMQDQEIVDLVSAALEDYSPPYSASAADMAARELVETATERPGAPPDILAVVALIPWSH